MRALVIVHEPDGPGGHVERRLVERGVDVDSHLINADPSRPDVAAPFPTLDGYDLVIPMGSSRSLTRKHEITAWIHDELDLVRAAHDRGTAVLGICFGGQLIADALGGRVEVAPVAELGWATIDDGDAPNPVGPGPWMVWHSDRVVPPPGAEVLARNDAAVQLFRVGRTVGTQFHPEVDAAHVEGFLRATPDADLAAEEVTRDEVLDDARRHEAANIEQCRALVDWYLDEVAFPDGCDGLAPRS